MKASENPRMMTPLCWIFTFLLTIEIWDVGRPLIIQGKKMPFVGRQEWEAHQWLYTPAPQSSRRRSAAHWEESKPQEPRILRMTLRKDSIRCQNKDSYLNPVNNKMILL